MQRKRYVAGIALFMALLMVLSVVFTAVSARAVSQSQIDALQESKKELQAKAKEIQAQIDELSRQQGSYIQRKAELDKQNELTRQEIDIINEQIALYDELIREKAVELEEAIAREREQYELFRTRMRVMEENGTIPYLAVLLQAASFSDLLSRLADISDIMEYDKKLESEYIAARENVQRIKAEYERVQEEQEQYRAELLDKKALLEKQIQAAYEMIAALEEDIDTYREAYEQNEKEEKALQSQIDKLIRQLQEEEAARKAAAAAAAAAASSGGKGSNTIVSKGSFIWPTPSSYSISSYYGYRIHPIFGTERFHSGIDIGASSGASILAAASGTVSIATYSSSYGNYVMISHGGGNATLYAHMSSMVVSAGDYVNQGDVIGYVGSTGWSTGPHLHFEIRINNSLVDPMTYFG